MKEKNIFLISITVGATLVLSLILAFVFKDAKAALWGLLFIPAIVVSFRSPRLGLLALLIYLPLGNTLAFSLVKVYKVVGNMIKFNGSYPLFKLAKDAFYFPALAGILYKNSSWGDLRPKIKHLTIAVGFLALSSLLTFFIVNLLQGRGGFSVGFIGLKTILGYLPLILCGYYLIQKIEDVWIVNRLLITLVVICCGLTLIQYVLLSQGICPDNEVLNKTKALVDLSRTKFYPSIIDKVTLKAQCFVGGSLLYNPAKNLIRLSGTFSDPWQWGWFLISSSFITYGGSFSESRRGWRVLGWVAMAGVLICAIISGQRIALLLVPLIYIVLLVITETRRNLLGIKLALIALLGISLATGVGAVQNSIASLIDRWNYSPPLQFMLGQLHWVTNRLSLFGNGLGVATSGARQFAGEEGTRLIETYYVKLLYEIGIVGFIAFMSVVTVITILTFKAYRSIKDPALRLWGLCLWVFILFISYNPYYYPLAVEPVSVYYWLFAGILLKLPELEEETQS
ncbi:MAG: hypothetical protein Cpurp_10730 [Chlorogloea purpurea SAG 13.99]|nr:hypothetical protein [Chlorogloea purpurea SAG 13.99]